MTWDHGGDPAFYPGDNVTYEYNNADNAVDPATEGMWVQYDGSYQVDTSDSTNNPNLDGVLADEVAPGEKTNVRDEGHVWARVESTVVSGDELGAGTTAGVADGSGGSGHVAQTAAEEHPSGSGDYFAKVQLDAR